MLPVAVTYDAWDCHSDFPSHCIDEKSEKMQKEYQEKEKELEELINKWDLK